MALRAAALAFLLLPSLSWAADLKLRWTWPSYNAMSDSCVDDSAKPLLDLYRGELRVVRWPQDDTLSLGYIPGYGMAGRADSCLVELADSIHYATFSQTPDDGKNAACAQSLLLAIPARDWQPGLRGTYYDNEDLTAKFLSRTDSQIAFTWGTGAAIPGMGADLFSEHWEGQINFPSAGVWSLSAIVEDGWRAWVGGVFVANDFGVQPVHESGAQFSIAAPGWTALIVEAMHHNGNAEITLSWTPPGGVKAPVPASALRH